ncbi:hydrogenase nickel incorporation protein HypB [Geodermatophilus sp. YIM 151500]|uniref:hydrogenase nickel incorporation protein HypB n=1 Tax=Geodermatophilus sp. YIM 151500 TaxID=2984531 RepID=UPI0021E4AF67|nr:hydrogenase nickel incorporation protein HypB [Geodermatophilus sp. YIM 151500]MCV2487927.1 hydrogenase nickel incorporation protein HypB [Geodermatophilus sp. YIM 151500]
MCGTCGCGEDDGPRFTRLDRPPQPHAHEHPRGHRHEHVHEQGHPHPHPHERDLGGADGAGGPHLVRLEQQVLGRNDALAARNRADFAARGLVVVNLMSSPGSGKTTLLERTVREVGRPVVVVEGDQETVVDAERIRAAGVPVVQVNTGSGCHLDAAMLQRGVAELDPPDGTLVVVENVGNLVCPALFDLGETRRVVVMSVPEGDDKPGKYPHMFRTADLVLVNKVDLLPYVTFDLPACVAQLRRLRPDVTVLAVSATRGDGMADWLAWLGRAADPTGNVTRTSIDSPAPTGV